MAQHDYVIDNSTGANVRADINNVLQAIATNNSGSSDPSTTLASQFFADTSAGIMKLRNTANSGYVNLFTLAGGVDVDAASNFNEDVTFTGATSGRNIVFDKSDNALEFADNAKAEFGTGGDLEIYHNGSNSYVSDIGTGNLHLTSNGAAVSIDKGTSENMAVFNTDGAAELYFDNSKKFETQNGGAAVTGGLNVSGNIALPDSSIFIAGTGDDLQIYHDGSNSYISDTGTGVLILKSNFISVDTETGETMATFDDNGAVSLYFDNSIKLATINGGISVTGGVNTTGASSFNGDIFFGDNNKTIFGAGGDLQIFHNGTNSVIDNNTGVLTIETTSNLEFNVQSNFRVLTKGGSENCIQGITDGAVELYFDNSKKFETTSGGIHITGSVACSGGSSNNLSLPDDGKAKFGTGDDLQIYHSGTNSFLRNSTGIMHVGGPGGDLLLEALGDVRTVSWEGENMIYAKRNGAVEVFFDNSKKLQTTNSGIAVIGKIGVGSSAANNSINTISAQGNGQTTLFYGFGTIDLTSASDERVKNNVMDTVKGLDDILKLRIVDFTYTPEYAEDSTTVRTGGIAQEWQKVDPNLVNSENDDLLFIEYKRVIPHLIKAVQQLSDKVAALEAA